jgi:hypothetical protein
LQVQQRRNGDKKPEEPLSGLWNSQNNGEAYSNRPLRRKGQGKREYKRADFQSD